MRSARATKTERWGEKAGAEVGDFSKFNSQASENFQITGIKYAAADRKKTIAVAI